MHFTIIFGIWTHFGSNMARTALDRGALSRHMSVGAAPFCSVCGSPPPHAVRKNEERLRYQTLMLRHDGKPYAFTFSALQTVSSTQT